MPKLIILRGLPGSGKSTYANMFLENNVSEEMFGVPKGTNLLSCVRVNKDMMRLMYQGGWFFGSDEHMNNLMYQSIEYFLTQNISVVSDNLNLDPKHMIKFFEIAREVQQKTGVDVLIEVHDVTTPLEVCIERDAKREVPVKKSTIELLHSRWCKNDTATGFPPVTIPVDLHIAFPWVYQNITGVKHAYNQPE